MLVPKRIAAELESGDTLTPTNTVAITLAEPLSDAPALSAPTSRTLIGKRSGAATAAFATSAVHLPIPVVGT